MGESVSQGISKHISSSPFQFLSIRVIIYVRELCPSSVHFAAAPHNCSVRCFTGGEHEYFKILDSNLKTCCRQESILADQTMDSAIHQINHYPANR